MRRGALVVDVERAATARQGAVFDDGDAGRGDALADAAGVGGCALAVEVALQAVADRFVQQYARPAAAQHHRHRAGGRLDRFQVHQSLAHRLPRPPLRTTTPAPPLPLVLYAAPDARQSEMLV